MGHGACRFTPAESASEPQPWTVASAPAQKTPSRWISADWNDYQIRPHSR